MHQLINKYISICGGVGVQRQFELNSMKIHLCLFLNKMCNIHERTLFCQVQAFRKTLSISLV